MTGDGEKWAFGIPPTTSTSSRCRHGALPSIERRSLTCTICFKGPVVSRSSTAVISTYHYLLIHFRLDIVQANFLYCNLRLRLEVEQLASCPGSLFVRTNNKLKICNSLRHSLLAFLPQLVYDERLAL